MKAVWSDIKRWFDESPSAPFIFPILAITFNCSVKKHWEFQDVNNLVCMAAIVFLGVSRSVLWMKSVQREQKIYELLKKGNLLDGFELKPGETRVLEIEITDRPSNDRDIIN